MCTLYSADVLSILLVVYRFSRSKVACRNRSRILSTKIIIFTRSTENLLRPSLYLC
jgi:hypothetical protein